MTIVMNGHRIELFELEIRRETSTGERMSGIGGDKLRLLQRASDQGISVSIHDGTDEGPMLIPHDGSEKRPITWSRLGRMVEEAEDRVTAAADAEGHSDEAVGKQLAAQERRERVVAPDRRRKPSVREADLKKLTRDALVQELLRLEDAYERLRKENDAALCKRCRKPFSHASHQAAGHTFVPQSTRE